MSIVKRNFFSKHPLYKQLSFTAFAFLLMVVFSYIFVTGIVRDNLIRNTESVLDFVQAQIRSDLMETQATLGSFARTIRSMILNGEDTGKILTYTNDISVFLRSRENSGLIINGLYSFIEELPGGPVFFNGLDGDVPDGYSPVDRPWYRIARAAGGSIAETPFYYDVITGEPIITYSCCIYDDKGGYLGVVCIDVRVDYIGEKVVNTALTKDGYGFLIAHDLTLLAHPNWWIN